MTVQRISTFMKTERTFQEILHIYGQKKNRYDNSGIKPEYTELKDKKSLKFLLVNLAPEKKDTIKSYLEERGAKVTGSVSSKTDYLIIGALGSPDWKYGDYGDKVAKAQELQKSGKSIVIIQESEFFESESKEGESNG